MQDVDTLPPIARKRSVSKTKYVLRENLKNPKSMPKPQSFAGEWAIVSPVKEPAYFDQGAQLVILAVCVLLSAYGLRQWITVEGWEAVFRFFWPVLAVGGLVLLGFIGYGLSIVQGWKRYRQSQAFGAPILFLSQEEFNPGDTICLSFQRDLKPDTPVVHDASVSAYLRCVEVAQNSAGSTTTYQHVVHAEHDLGQQSISGLSLRASFSEKLSPSALPTSLEKDHWIVWEVQVRQQVPGQLDETTSFLIPVVSGP